MMTQVSIFGHGFAAALFAALTIWQFQRKTERNKAQFALGMALAWTSFCALATAVEGASSLISSFAESIRTLGWLIFMFILLRSGEGRDQPTAVEIIYVA